MAKKIRLVIFGFLLLVIIGLGALAYHYSQQASKVEISTTTQDGAPMGAATSTLNDTASLVGMVGKLILLPVGEEPTVATVSDPSKLKDQAFFDNAQIGDKVLIYQKAKKAYLYSVSLNKLIEVAPINIGESAPAAATTSKTVIKKK